MRCSFTALLCLLALSSGCGTARHDEPAAPPLRRLTTLELQSSIEFLLGVQLDWTVESDLREHGFGHVGASHAVTSVRGVEDYTIALDRAVDRVARTPDRLSAVLRCDDLGAWAECVETTLSRFAALAWRRPLTPDELTRYRALGDRIAATTDDPVERGRTLLFAVLASPNFLYRNEPVVAEDEYVGAAMAARLSFFIWNLPPDEALLTLAANGALDTPEGVADAARWMLDDPRAAGGIDAFVADLFAVESLRGIEREPLNLLNEVVAFYISENGSMSEFLADVRASELGEMQRIFRHVALETDADMMDVFTTPITFVDDTLMRFYDGEVEVLADLPPRTEPPEEPEEVDGCLAPVAYICDGRDPCEKFIFRLCDRSDGDTDECFDQRYEAFCSDREACFDYFDETCPGADLCAWIPDYGCEDPDGSLVPETVGYDPYVPYGIDGWAMARRDTDEVPRAGILGTLGFLSLHGSAFDTSPTRRGRFIVENLLCRPMAPPPVEAAGVTLPMNGESRRAQHESVVSGADCAGCHDLMDGPGFALDVFGPGGIPRESDRFGHAFDLTGSLDGVAFDGPLDLAETIAAHPDARACMARSLYRFATGSAADADDVTLSATLAVKMDEADGRYRDFVLALVTSPEFRHRAPEHDAVRAVPDLDAVQRNVLFVYCDGCHTDTGAGHLSFLNRDGLRDRLLEPSTQLPSMALVRPGDTARSYLWHKVEGTHASVGGSGDRMAPEVQLPTAARELLRAWIEAGAPE